jgi:hypothetical protein
MRTDRGSPFQGYHGLALIVSAFVKRHWNAR